MTNIRVLSSLLIAQNLSVSIFDLGDKVDQHFVVLQIASPAGIVHQFFPLPFYQDHQLFLIHFSTLWILVICESCFSCRRFRLVSLVRLVSSPLFSFSLLEH